MCTTHISRLRSDNWWVLLFSKIWFRQGRIKRRPTTVVNNFNDAVLDNFSSNVLCVSLTCLTLTNLQDALLLWLQVTDSDDDDSCIICMAEPRCCALTPCGHRAYCETCCLRLIELDQMCSLCRGKADGYLIIYL